MSHDIKVSIFYVAVDIGPDAIEDLMSRYELAYDRMSENHCYDVYHTAPSTPDGFTLVLKVFVQPEVGSNRVRSAARLEAMRVAFKCLHPTAEDSPFVGLQPFLHPTFNRATRLPYPTGYIVPFQDRQENILKNKAKKDQKEYVFVDREDAAPELLDDQVNASSAPGGEGQ